MTADQLRERAEEIDNTVLQQVSNRGLKPGYVRDLVLAAVNEALAEQKMVNGVFDKEPWEVAWEPHEFECNGWPKDWFRIGFEAGRAAVEESIIELQDNAGDRREWWSGGTWIPPGYRLVLLPAPVRAEGG